MMEQFEIKLPTMGDLPAIRECYANARALMKRTGNPNQWKDNKPLDSLVVEDVEKGRSRVILKDGEIIGVFFFSTEPDPTYAYIEGGEWQNSESYAVIHRIAGNGKAPGVLKAAVSYGSQFSNNLRIDTHNDNKIMQHLLEKYGFKKCGIIYLEDGEPRLAYHKVISDQE